jgi:hypothetical protein
MYISRFLAAVSVLPAAFGVALSPRGDVAVDSIEEINNFVPTDDLAVLAAQGLQQVQEFQASGIESRSTKCNLRNVVIRRDW